MDTNSHQIFEKENNDIWQGYKQKIFTDGILKNTEWKEIHEIAKVLRIISSTPHSNFAFSPEMGGDEIDKVKYSNSVGCVDLYSCGLFITVKPVSLRFEFLDDDFDWSYFRLETKEFCENQPSGIFLIVKKTSAFNYNILDSGFHNKVSSAQLREKISSIFI